MQQVHTGNLSEVWFKQRRFTLLVSEQNIDCWLDNGIDEPALELPVFSGAMMLQYFFLNIEVE